MTFECLQPSYIHWLNKEYDIRWQKNYFNILFIQSSGTWVRRTIAWNQKSFGISRKSSGKWSMDLYPFFIFLKNIKNINEYCHLLFKFVNKLVANRKLFFLLFLIFKKTTLFYFNFDILHVFFINSHINYFS